MTEEMGNFTQLRITHKTINPPNINLTLICYHINLMPCRNANSDF